MRRFSQLLVVLLLVITSFLGGFYVDRWTDPIPQREALKDLEYFMACHQYYIDRPEELAKLPGINSSLELQEELVEKYERIIDLIKSE